MSDDGRWFERAERLGVATSYWDVHGGNHTASLSAVRTVCELLLAGGGETSGGDPIDEVVLVRGGELRSGLRPSPDAPLPHTTIVLEDGTTVETDDPASEIVRLPIGMHELLWRDATARDRVSTVLVAPSRFPLWSNDGGRQRLTVFAPTYALWERNNPLPSFDGIARLGAAMDEFGVGTIATLPLYAPGPPSDFEASPYSPISRFHWNELLIPPRLLGDDTAAPPVGDRLVWSTVQHGRLGALDAFVAAMTPAQRAALDGWLADHPDVGSYARFIGGDDAVAVRCHEAGQWLAEEAMADVASDLASRGQRLALDLPVGARLRSWETARWPDLFSSEVCIGAPPDTFFAGGQNWELPALNPATSRRTGHQVWRRLLEAACRHAGVLRIDHVMQVHRLWWIPDGHAPDDGVYVHYPADELLAVAAIVAEQTGTLMVGENLGTVPDEVAHRLDDWALRGMYEEVFTMHAVLGTTGHAGDALPPVRSKTWAGIRTHDMPALARTLDEVDTAHYRSVLGAELGRPVGDDVAEVAAAMFDRLQASDAHAVVIDLHDVLGDRAAHNEPGQIHEGNWTDRVDVPIEELAADARVRSLFVPEERPGYQPPRPPFVGDLDLHLLFEGSHRRLHEVMGAHPTDDGCWFSVWAPNARSVRVLVDVDGWRPDHWLERRGDSGVWSGHLGGIGAGVEYHFRIETHDGRMLDKSDPFAAASSEPPSTTSRVAELGYTWGDADWMAGRGERIALDAPVSIYEVHLGSWGRRLPSAGRRFPTYEELADPLADHAHAHGFTHVELLPVTEHPFYGSWGYQTTGYFCPTARFGTPTEFMAMVDRLHQRGIGVIVDWVPSHFPYDPHGLASFDGTALFEHADPRQGFHPDWNSAVFNYGRNEVRAFLRSSAMCWLERFHIDGLRVDAVASMLYLDYSRNEGEWIPNVFGGRENLEAISFLKDLNEVIYTEHPDVATFAEESTAWPMVSRPTYLGGLGFGYKWDMGWMHDTLQYLQRDSVYRKFHHGEITFRSVYAFSENFTLPLSHDEVVHGKGSILGKMPGDHWQKFANVRLLYGMQWAQPGKKLLFMGGELASPAEWDHESVLDWGLHDADLHAGVRRLVAALNSLYRSEPAMHRMDCHPDGMEWLVGDDVEHSVFVWLRRAPDSRPVMVIVNATPGVHQQYRVGVPVGGKWVELLSSDATEFGGGGVHAVGPEGVFSAPIESHGRPESIAVSVPPLAVAVLAPAESAE